MSGWRVEVSMPFDGFFSKNRANRIRKKKRSRQLFVGRSDESRARQTALAALVRGALGRTKAKPVRDRLFVLIEVEKTDHRADAVNVLDVVCDAVSDATGVDDRWFEVAGIRWSIVPDRPTLRVTAWQHSEAPARLCTACRRTRDLDAFAPSKSGPLGRAWFCRECAKARRAR